MLPSALRALDVSRESDGSALGSGWAHELADRGEDGGNGPIVRGELLIETRFELIDTAGKLLVRGHQLPKLHEGAHDVDADHHGAVGFREFERRNWSTVRSLSSEEFVRLGAGGGQIGIGADPQIPSRRNPRGGIVPSVDVTVVFWWVRRVLTQGQEGYEVRSYIKGLIECREDDPCKAPNETVEAFVRDYTPWKRVAVRDINEDRIEYMRPYGELKLPVPLPGMP